MPEGRTTFSITARQVTCVALLAYCGGIWMLAVVPWRSLNWLEFFIAGLAIIAAIGLIALMIPSIKVPGEQYAYLVSGLVGVIALIAYDYNSLDATHQKIRASLLLLTGIVGSYGAYIAMPHPYDAENKDPAQL